MRFQVRFLCKATKYVPKMSYFAFKFSRIGASASGLPTY